MTLPLKDKLSKILVERKLIKESDLAKALSLQKEKARPLSDILVDLGFVSRSDLVGIMSEELGIPPINLARYKIDPEVIKFIPKKIAKHYKIFPVSKIGNTLTVAMSDPLNIFAIDDMKSLTGLKISPVVAVDKDITEAIERHYEEDAYAAIEKIVGDMKESEDVKVIEERAIEQGSTADLIRMTQDAPIIKITNMLLAEGVKLRSSDILIEPLEDDLRIRYRVDGILQEAKRPPKTLHAAIVSRLKVMSDLNIAERRLPQDGRFKVRLSGHEVDFRISVLPSSKGEKVALRILDKSQAMLDIDKLGFDQNSLVAIKKEAAKPHGMILISGPTGCGKTTTLYSILTHVNSAGKNIVTVEDPVEYELEGINQVTSRPEIGLTFATALRAILRQDPNIIMIGEIRDPETVDIAIKAALTGHLVLSTLHTTTATGSIVRLANMGAEPFLITSSLLLVGSQRLVRKLCPNCKEAYTLSGEVIDRLKIKVPKPGMQVYRAKGCPACSNTGYRGRTAFGEVLVLTPHIKSLILENAPEYKIRDEARKEGMETLRENGLKNLFDGTTSLEEILRVTIGDQDIGI